MIVNKCSATLASSPHLTETLSRSFDSDLWRSAPTMVISKLEVCEGVTEVVKGGSGVHAALWKEWP